MRCGPRQRNGRGIYLQSVKDTGGGGGAVAARTEVLELMMVAVSFAEWIINCEGPGMSNLGTHYKILIKTPNTIGKTKKKQ